MEVYIVVIIVIMFPFIFKLTTVHIQIPFKKVGRQFHSLCTAHKQILIVYILYKPFPHFLNMHAYWILVRLRQLYTFEIQKHVDNTEILYTLGNMNWFLFFLYYTYIHITFCIQNIQEVWYIIL